MKRLLLLRHAKSDWSDPSVPDERRPLNRRGERARHRMAGYLRRAELGVDRIVTSPATRAATTAAAVADALEVTVEVDPRLYTFGAAGVLAVVRGLPDAHDTVLLAGHNPAFEDLSADLTGEMHDYLTASLGVIDLPVEQWRLVRTDGSATLERLVHPRDLPG